jgi:hypothetical protein
MQIKGGKGSTVGRRREEIQDKGVQYGIVEE